jgi:nitrogen fixation/metabolism regulation signal transduction histidine kinase
VENPRRFTSAVLENLDERVIACDQLGELRIVNAAARGLGAGEPLALGDRAGAAGAAVRPGRGVRARGRVSSAVTSSYAQTRCAPPCPVECAGSGAGPVEVPAALRPTIDR